MKVFFTKCMVVTPQTYILQRLQKIIKIWKLFTFAWKILRVGWHLMIRQLSKLLMPAVMRLMKCTLVHYQWHSGQGYMRHSCLWLSVYLSQWLYYVHLKREWIAAAGCHALLIYNTEDWTQGLSNARPSLHQIYCLFRGGVLLCYSVWLGTHYIV